MKILGIIGMILFLYQQLKLQIASKKENQLETDIEKNTLAHQQQIIELCIDLLKPNGKVLQFGFSHGFSGNKIWIGARGVSDLAGNETIDNVFTGKIDEFSPKSKKVHIDIIKERLIEIKAKIIRGPLDGAWAPGYYYILFEDPTLNS